MGLTLVVPGRRWDSKSLPSPPPQCLAHGLLVVARAGVGEPDVNFLLAPPLTHSGSDRGRVTQGVCLLCLNSCRNLSFNALETLSWKTVQGLSLQEL